MMWNENVTQVLTLTPPHDTQVCMEEAIQEQMDKIQ